MTISDVKALAEDGLRITESATGGKWTANCLLVSSDVKRDVAHCGYGFGEPKESERNALHIADARTRLPKLARIVLAAILAVDCVCDMNDPEYDDGYNSALRDVRRAIKEAAE